MSKTTDYRKTSRTIRFHTEKGDAVILYRVIAQTGLSNEIPISTADSIVFLKRPGRFPLDGFPKFVSLPASEMEEETEAVEVFQGFVKEGE